MRKLASVQRVKFVRPIKGADAIECVGVLGWECVVKKGEFREGDLCVYFEIDSLLPEKPEFEFLKNSCWSKDVNRHRLRTIRMRGQISQGLAMPMSSFVSLPSSDIGYDLTDFLGIEKWEPLLPAQIAGDLRSFSWPIDKTDETRIQQDDEYRFLERLSGEPYYISLKLDGTSCSFVIDPNDGEFHACGRNYSYKRNSDHSFWQLAERFSLENGLRSLGGGLALQGEVVGPGIQKNRMGLNKAEFYVFNVVDVASRSRLHIDEALEVTSRLGIPFVPILERGDSFGYEASDLLEMAKGSYFDYFPNAKLDQPREGLVVRSLCGSISFKCINNDFLLAEK